MFHFCCLLQLFFNLSRYPHFTFLSESNVLVFFNSSCDHFCMLSCSIFTIFESSLATNFCHFCQSIFNFFNSPNLCFDFRQKMFFSRQVSFFRKMFRKDFLPDAKFVVGQDHFGNVYFEVPAARRTKRISSHGLTHDSPTEKIDAFMKGQYQNKTPTEWQHWLR